MVAAPSPVFATAALLLLLPSPALLEGFPLLLDQGDLTVMLRGKARGETGDKGVGVLFQACQTQFPRTIRFSFKEAD